MKVHRILENIFDDIYLSECSNLRLSDLPQLSFLLLYLLHNMVPKLFDVTIKVLQSKLIMTIITKSNKSLQTLLESNLSTSKPAKQKRYNYRKYFTARTQGK